MILKSETPISYVKFKNHGDAVTGVFVSYQENVPSKCGPENLLTLQTDTRTLIVKAPTNLSRTLRENLASLPGKRLTVTYTGDAPSRKGNPCKLFRVDAEEAEKSPAAVPIVAANSPMSTADATPARKVG